MKRKTLLVPVFAALFLFAISFVSADEIVSGGSNGITTEFNGVELGSSTTMAGSVGNTVPVRVIFEAKIDVSDVRVKVSMEGHREEISASTNRFDVINGSTYSKLLSLELPSDAKDLSKEYTLYVEVVSSSDKSEKMYTVRIQRESYTLEILSVDYPTQVTAGSTIPVSVVVKNNGFNREDDNYIVASISALGITARSYIGDLIPVEDADLDEEEDSTYNRVYLKIPSSAQSGVYDLEVMAYNKDSKTMVKKKISVGESESATILAASKSKDLNAGETITYDIIVVNSEKSVKIFNLETVSGDVLKVTAPSVFTVGPDSSKTIPITVKASEDASIGTYSFSVKVDGKQFVFGANVIGSAVSTSVVALTVVLVIIFVVLLAVLVVLLTRKEKPIEDIETSYY